MNPTQLKKIFNKCNERFDGDKAKMHGVRYALEMVMREAGNYDYFTFSEQVTVLDRDSGETNLRTGLYKRGLAHPMIIAQLDAIEKEDEAK